jgi:hypothetical protein
MSLEFCARPKELASFLNGLNGRLPSSLLFKLCSDPPILLLGPLSTERLICTSYLHLFWRGLLLLLVLLFPLVRLACSGGLVVV